MMNTIKYPECRTFVWIHIEDEGRKYTVIGFWDNFDWHFVGISNLSAPFGNKIVPSIVVGWSELSLVKG